MECRGQSREFYTFYAPEAHVPYSLLFIPYQFCNGGSSPSMAIKFLYETKRREQGDKVHYAPAPPPLTVWALKPPSWALVHKTTYAPMIYTALYSPYTVQHGAV
jgi:hypothetical protein